MCQGPRRAQSPGFTRGQDSYLPGLGDAQANQQITGHLTTRGRGIYGRRARLEVSFANSIHSVQSQQSLSLKSYLCELGEPQATRVTPGGSRKAPAACPLQRGLHLENTLPATTPRGASSGEQRPLPVTGSLSTGLGGSCCHL